MFSKKKKAILLINLGSPDSTSTSDLRKYLDEFLMDERVIDKGWLWRALLVKGIIVPFRAEKSAEAYQKIWTKDGSPLIVYTRQLQEALQKNTPYPVEIAMRYGSPSPADAFKALLEKVPDLEEVITLPLYPHYAMSSYETAVEYVKETCTKNKYSFSLSFVPPFFEDPLYIKALAERIKPYLSEPYDQLLFSYHGIPERHIRKSDLTGNHCLKDRSCCETDSLSHAHCYRHQVITTTRKVASTIGIPIDKYQISFQSRLGKGWLQPFTDIRLTELPAEGIRKLLIVCPAFVSDCLETLEEIEIRGRKSFMESGGETFRMIPCLNVNPLWVEAITNYVTD